MPPRPDPRPRKRTAGRPAAPGRSFKQSGRPARPGQPAKKTGGSFKRTGGSFKKAGGSFKRTGGSFKKAGGSFKRSGSSFKKAGGSFKRSGSSFKRAGAPRRGDDRRRRDDDRRPEGRPEGRAGNWGGVARRGAGSGGSAGGGRLRPDGPSAASEAFRDAAPEPWQPERFERVDDPADTGRRRQLRRSAQEAVDRSQDPDQASAPRSRRKPPTALTEELARETGASVAPKLAERLADAGRAYERERYEDARRILVPLAKRAPGAPAVRELLGVVWYRLGRWRDAVNELEAFRSLTSSTEQHPVLADSYRALRRYDEVDELWRELREASPSAELVAEGRIVLAGAQADRGDLRAAIATIEPAVGRARRPRGHQLRLLYVLADLYERAGDVPRARTLFDRVLAADEHFADAPARRRALG